MKCCNCGFENDLGSNYCAKCGNALKSETVILSEAETNRALALKKIVDISTDKLFYVICICLSVFVGLDVVLDSINIINLLIMIFAWIIFANGRKNIADAKKVQCISGTVYFIYIMNYVASGLILLASCLSAYALNSVAFKEAVSSSTLDLYGLDHLYGILEWLWALPWLIVVIGIILAISCFLINVFGWQKIHAFIKSVHESASNGAPDYKCCKSARNWLIVFAIIDAVSLLSFNIVALLIGALPIALQIMGAMIIDKHFLKENM